MEIGSKVKQIIPVITGVIADTNYNKSTKSLDHLVEYAEGEATQARWFSEAELEEVL